MTTYSLVVMLLLSIAAHAQDPKLWTAEDRKYLLDNLTRSRDELVRETKGLSKDQWSFKESADSWSINQIIEHIAIWELLLDYRLSKQLGDGPQPELAKHAEEDSTYLGFIMETKKHVSTDYTKPFTFTVPMGINELKSNTAWLLKLRNESIDYVGSTKDDLRLHLLKESGANMHQTYITLFGHADRHLRQIKRVKQHPKFPKA